MQLKTILNRVTDYKSFVFGKVRWLEGESPALEIELQPRANGRPVCSGCVKVRPGYDQASEHSAGGLCPRRRLSYQHGREPVQVAGGAWRAAALASDAPAQ